MARRGRKNRGKRGKKARQAAVSRAQKRIQKIRKKPGRPTPAQRDRIKNLRATIKANTGRRNPPKAASKPAPKPSPSRTSNRGPAPTAQGRGPVITAQTTPRSSFSASNQPANFGTNTRSAKPIDKGGSVPSVMSNQYSGNSPRNFDHGNKFTKKDVKAMRGMGFTAQQTRDYVAKNNLGGTRQGKRIISKSRGEFDKAGQYDYGLQFGKGDIRRLRQAGSTNQQIRSYINQQGIDNRVAQRFLSKNPAQTAVDTGRQPTTVPSTLAETSNPEFTTPIDTSTTPKSNQELPTKPDLEGYTKNEDIQSIFDQYMKEAGLTPKNNADPADLEVPEIEETAPYMGSIPTPKTTTESADPTWSTSGTNFTTSTMYPGGATNPWSFTPAFQPKPFTTQTPVMEELPTTDNTGTPTLTQPTVQAGAFDPASYSQPTSAAPTIAVANDFVKSGSPKIQPVNPFTGLGYTLGTDGLPAYMNQTYGTGTALPGQLTPQGTVEGGYEPDVPDMPTPPTTPYHNQYAKGGIGYLPGQAGDPNGSFGTGIRPLTLKKKDGQYTPMPLYA